jgi:hypothetical protein
MRRTIEKLRTIAKAAIFRLSQRTVLGRWKSAEQTSRFSSTSGEHAEVIVLRPPAPAYRTEAARCFECPCARVGCVS